MRSRLVVQVQRPTDRDQLPEGGGRVVCAWHPGHSQGVNRQGDRSVWAPGVPAWSSQVCPPGGGGGVAGRTWGRACYVCVPCEENMNIGSRQNQWEEECQTMNKTDVIRETRRDGRGWHGENRNGRNEGTERWYGSIGGMHVVLCTT